MENDNYKYDENSESEFAFMKRVVIPRADGARYIDRFILIRCRLGSIMFHRIFSTDHDCMHDHPWSFFTILLKGGYFEQTPDSPNPAISAYKNSYKEKFYKPGSILYRPANFIHRLRIVKEAWTIVFTGPEKRYWGFWTKFGWVRSRKYPNVGSCK